MRVECLMSSGIKINFLSSASPRLVVYLFKNQLNKVAFTCMIFKGLVCLNSILVVICFMTLYILVGKNSSFELVGSLNIEKLKLEKNKQIKRSISFTWHRTEPKFSLLKPAWRNHLLLIDEPNLSFFKRVYKRYSAISPLNRRPTSISRSPGAASEIHSFEIKSCWIFNMKVNNLLYLHRYIICAVDVQDISIELAKGLREFDEGFYSEIKIRQTFVTAFGSFSVGRLVIHLGPLEQIRISLVERALPYLIL